MSVAKRCLDIKIDELRQEWAESPSNYLVAAYELQEKGLGIRSIVRELKKQLSAVRVRYDRVWNGETRRFDSTKIEEPDYRARMDALKELISIHGFRFVPKQDTKIEVTNTEIQIINEVRSKDYNELVEEAKKLGITDNTSRSGRIP